MGWKQDKKITKSKNMPQILKYFRFVAYFDIPRLIEYQLKYEKLMKEKRKT